ncbi:DUF6326 family protein [Nocardioides marmoraquaticus]
METLVLDDQPAPVRTRLAAAWTSFALLYAYVDILHFYTPGAISDILDGRVFEFDLSQTFSTSALALVSVPILMTAMSVTLPARAARVLNLAVAALYVPVTAFNLAGETWLAFYGLGVALELALLVLVVRWSWAWPHAASTVPASAAAVR